MECYPSYLETHLLDNLRATEYRRLDERRQVYLDYTGNRHLHHAISARPIDPLKNNLHFEFECRAIYVANDNIHFFICSRTIYRPG